MINKKCNGIVRVKEHMREGHKVAAYDRRCGRHNYHDYMDFYPSDLDDKVYERERNSQNSKQKGNMLSDSLIALLQLFWAIKDGDTLGYLQAINALVNSPFFQVFTDWIGQFDITPDMLDFKERSAEFLASDEGQAELANALQPQTTYPINHNLENVSLPVKDISNNIAISEPVSSKYANMDDVVKIKGALAVLGYYTPPKNSSMTPYFDNELSRSISNFQQAIGMPSTGSVQPESLFIEKINSRLDSYPGGAVEAAKDAFSTSLFSEPSTAVPSQALIFTGKSLALYENGLKTKEWAGVSGADGYQTPNWQDSKNKGHIPQGSYLARQERYQTINMKDNLIGSVSGLLSRGTGGIIPKRGKWHGGSYAWGEHRIWLEPSFITNTFGRDGFTIHGGDDPGSVGCIDLTDMMPDFAKWYRNNGKDMIVHVKY